MSQCMFLHLSNFGLSLSPVVDFSNSGNRALASAEQPPCLPM